MILAIEASGAETKLWLLDSIQAPTEPDVVWESGRQLADGLLGRIEALLAAKDSSMSQISGIVVFAGPGSFTTLRIVHTVANALADGLNVPVVNAMGENWLADALARVSITKPGQPALPMYGAEANVTKPKH